MSYTVKDLISRFRLDMDDLEETYLWTDDEIKEYLDQAQVEFTELVDVLYSEEETDYSANDEWVAIPSYVTRLRGAYDPANEKDLALENYERFKETMPSTSWRKDKAAFPSALITDLSPNHARAYPVPETNGTLVLDVYRNPKTRVADGAELEVKDRQQQLAILLFARAVAYRKHDSEAYDARQADLLENKFYDLAAEFKRRAARKRRRTVAVMYGGI